MHNMIMVPTDGSGFDREAIRVALRMGERTGAEVRLVRVLATGSFFGAAPAGEHMQPHPTSCKANESAR